MQVTLKGAPLPPDFLGNPQEFFDAILERMQIEVDGTSFVRGDTQPTGNEGPWLKNDREWWVWDSATSTYVPLDISASARSEIHVGDTPPDTTLPQFPTIWFKTSGATLLGVWFWTGSETKWVQQNRELVPDAVKSEHIQDGAIQSRHLAPGSISPSKLTAITPNLLTPGNEKTYLKTKDGVAQWVGGVVESPLITFVSGQKTYSWAHGLGVKPNIVRAVFVPLNAKSGWTVDDEIEASAYRWDTYESIIALNANATHVVFRCSKYIHFPKAGDGLVTVTIDGDIPNWMETTARDDFKLKLYAGAL